jgi:hybrid cluster-associated redox disulfide protein
MKKAGIPDFAATGLAYTMRRRLRLTRIMTVLTSGAIAEMTVEDVLTEWPQTADVFNRHNMACVGCPVAPFYSVAEAVAVYALSLEEFAAELQQAISGEKV